MQKVLVINQAKNIIGNYCSLTSNLISSITSLTIRNKVSITKRFYPGSQINNNWALFLPKIENALIPFVSSFNKIQPYYGMPYENFLSLALRAKPIDFDNTEDYFNFRRQLYFNFRSVKEFYDALFQRTFVFPILMKKPHWMETEVYNYLIEKHE